MIARRISASCCVLPRGLEHVRPCVDVLAGVDVAAPGGLLRTDAAKITADAKLDGKYLSR
jgi:hypothetical protein